MFCFITEMKKKDIRLTCSYWTYCNVFKVNYENIIDNTDMNVRNKWYI